MTRDFSKAAALLASFVTATVTATPATAQDFGQASGSLLEHVRSICPLLGGIRANDLGATADQLDLFDRCNAALNAPGDDGFTTQGDILDQYNGVQNIAQQSDGAARSNRSDRALMGRMDAIAGQLRQRQFASLGVAQPILLAQTDPTEIPEMSGMRPSKLDGFLTLGGFDGEQDSTDSEVGFSQDGFYVSAGLDYSFTESFVGGAAISFLDGSADFDSIAAGVGSAGGMDTESISVSAYGIYFPTERLEVNGLISLGQSDFSNTRVISVFDINGGGFGTEGQVNRVASSESEADTFQIAIGGSYAYFLEGGTSFIPSVELNYFNSDIGGFTETGAGGLNLTFGDQEIDSLQASVGGTLNRTFSADWGVFVPYVRGRAIFELQDDEQSVIASYAAASTIGDLVTLPPDFAASFRLNTNPADEFSGDLAIGGSAVWSNGFSGFAEVSSVIGLENVTYTSLSVGLRYEF